MECCGDTKKCSTQINLTPVSVDDSYSINEIIDRILFRVGYKRDSRTVVPGLYAINNPGKNSDIVVTCNLKITFDLVRSALQKRSMWILVLDTRGVNVWCAAGKGTFGTFELLKKIKATNLKEYAPEGKIILPQLGAPGISAFSVAKQSGFKVVWGPVELSDLGAFIDVGYKATPQMREVQFPLLRRLELCPLEFFLWSGKLALIALPILLATIFELSPLSFQWHNFSTQNLIALLLSFFTGNLIFQLLLPLLPFRSFLVKGFFLGFVFQLMLIFAGVFSGNLTRLVSSLFVFPIITSYLAYNFTGCTHYTSPSGVKYEYSTFYKWLKYLWIFSMIVFVANDLVNK